MRLPVSVLEVQETTINNRSARKLHFTFCSFFLTNTIMKHVEFSGNELLKPNTINKKICYKHPYNSKKKNRSSKTFKVTQTAVPLQHSLYTHVHENTHSTSTVASASGASAPQAASAAAATAGPPPLRLPRPITRL